jgi:hypothetical protein
MTCSLGDTPAMDQVTAGFDERLAAIDTSLFSHVQTQTTERDRIALLVLENACREVHGEFAYLEIGSHLGGSLQVLVADPLCVAITSIDARPERQPDDRDDVVEYPGNSTKRMLDLLAQVPGADLSKLHTIDAGTDTLSPTDVPVRPQLCFVDGEHTRAAALRDARFCRDVLAGAGAIAFHDRKTVESAIADFVEELGAGGEEYSAYRLPGQLYMVELGPPRLAGPIERLDARCRERGLLPRRKPRAQLSEATE